MTYLRWYLSVALFLVLGCGQPERPLISTQAPAFTLPTTSGDSVSLTQYQDKVRLVVFWATWCSPCLMEISTLKQLQTELGSQGLQIIAINIDEGEGAGGQLDLVKQSEQRFAFNYPVVLGGMEIVKAFGSFQSLPTNFLVSRDGRIQERIVGLVPHETLRQKIVPWLTYADSTTRSE